jgi:hypothetical protein
MKSFEFDYNNMKRIKINEKVVFKEIIKLKSVIVYDGKKEESDGIKEEYIVKCDESSKNESGYDLDDERCKGNENEISKKDDDYKEDDEGIDMSNGKNHHENEKNRRNKMEKGK